MESASSSLFPVVFEENPVNFAKPPDPSAGLGKPESKQNYSILK